MLRKPALWSYDTLDKCDPEFRDKCDQRMLEARCDIMETKAITEAGHVVVKPNAVMVAGLEL